MGTQTLLFIEFIMVNLVKANIIFFIGMLSVFAAWLYRDPNSFVRNFLDEKAAKAVVNDAIFINIGFPNLLLSFSTGAILLAALLFTNRKAAMRACLQGLIVVSVLRVVIGAFNQVPGVSPPVLQDAILQCGFAAISVFALASTPATPSTGAPIAPLLKQSLFALFALSTLVAVYGLVDYKQWTALEFKGVSRSTLDKPAARFTLTDGLTQQLCDALVYFAVVQDADRRTGAIVGLIALLSLIIGFDSTSKARKVLGGSVSDTSLWIIALFCVILLAGLYENGVLGSSKSSSAAAAAKASKSPRRSTPKKASKAVVEEIDEESSEEEIVVKRSPARSRSPARKSPAKKSPARKSPAKKSPAKRAPAARSKSPARSPARSTRASTRR